MNEVAESFFYKELKPILETYLHENLIVKIDEAYKFSEEAHRDQLRASGEPYILHPLNIAKILAENKASSDIIIGSLLHDCIEDTGVNEAVLTEKFGTDITDLVKLLTKLKNIKFDSEEEGQAENLRKLLLSMASDVRVVLIKIVDRLHNMRTLDYLSSEKQKRISQETMDIYVPIVHRLGIYSFKWELEDLSFKYLKPEEYKTLSEKVSKKRKDREEYINKVVDILSTELTKIGIKSKIEGRPKNLFSTYKKMQKENKTLDEIYDLFAVRVLVQDVKDCYEVLGVIHNIWKPVPGRIKDYISSPKPNGYRSLHTTIFGPGEEPVEIQIRTNHMHMNNEVGIAAHWKYKEEIKEDKDFDEKIKWLRQLFDWHTETNNAKDFVSSVKYDLFRDEIFAFTPKGKVIDLPEGATPIDFAYRIHSDIGNSCVGAKVNGKIATIDYKLKTGDRVQILTTKIPKGPSRDWIKFARSASTKAKIRSWFKKHIDEDKREDEIEQKEELKTTHVQQTKNIKHIPSKVTSKTNYLVLVEGGEDLPLVFPKCCNPLPNDEIVGYISKGKGITIHRKTCPNLKVLSREKERILPASWRIDKEISFLAGLYIKAKNEPGVLAQVSQTISDQGLNVFDLKATSTTGNSARITVKITVKNIGELTNLIDKLSRLTCIEKVRRF